MTSFENDQLVKRAVSHLRLGNTAEAQEILAACVKENPQNEAAWLGLAKCVSDSERVRFCLEKVLSLDTKNAEAKAALRRLQSGKEPFPELKKYYRRREERSRPKPQKSRTSRQDPGRLDMQELFHKYRKWILIGGAVITFLIAVAIISAVRKPATVPLRGEEEVSASATKVPQEDGEVTGTRGNVAQPTSMIPTDEARLLPANWQEWPVVPEVTERAKDIYRIGLEQGRDPQAFSVIGDCHSAPDVLFARLVDPEFTRPAEYSNYVETLDVYSGSWERDFVTVKNGMSAASIRSPYWNDEERCEVDESPLACEIRLHNPSIIIISIGTNWLEEEYEPFEDYYRKALDEIIAAGIVPVIATKADPTDPDFPLNLIMARLAYEYDIPCWNFWSAVQDLPDHGLDVDYEEGHHLLHAAWDVKRFTGVQVMDALYQALKDETILPRT